MPTRHIEPQSDEHLDSVSGALLRARRVVVITGAGISTNSGIPDFRSENGLYSLVQAQFDAAARQARRAESAAGAGDCDDGDDARPAKRRKTCQRDSTAIPDDEPERIKPEPAVDPDPEHPPSYDGDANTELEPVASRRQPCEGADAPLATPRPKITMASTPGLATSPLSSPPADHLMIPPPALRSLADVSLQQSSSPLSSPPPTLFDSFMPCSPSVEAASRRSSTSVSEADGSTSHSSSLGSSQTSNQSRGVLPNIKGKDLFDATIWSDPIRTSVFYTFATSLRQKIKSAEPSSSHRFISHLRDRGKLVRCYTQNIDQIEEKVGLSTCLKDGPGSKGRFSRRCTANTSQLSKMVDEATAAVDEPSKSESPSNSDDGRGSNPSRSLPAESSDGSGVPEAGDDVTHGDRAKPSARPQKRDVPRSGVECVFLHGSLELLRCFLCGRVCSWEEDEREAETLTGQQPECPHCVGATAAREERGKRALGVGKLRPDIVLYGEEHPSSHLISPIVTHDLGLHPDMLLILGTSLRVHGLKVMVREFAKAVHSKGGKVVFVNLNKPPESSWGDVIDYWVQWDCDAWVADLQGRIPRLWQHPDAPRPKKKREAGVAAPGKQEDKKRPPAANPVALRDTKATGAFWTAKVLRELARITGRGPPARRASAAGERGGGQSTGEHQPPPLAKRGKARPRPSRKSAPGALEQCMPTAASSTVDGDGDGGQPGAPGAGAAGAGADDEAAMGSILDSVKENARIRKRKLIDGEEVAAPGAARRRGRGQGHEAAAAADLRLPPLQSPPCLFGRPEPLEPTSLPSGPLASLSPNLRNASGPRLRLLDAGPRWARPWGVGEAGEWPAARDRGKVPAAAGPHPPPPRGDLGRLADWGSSWRR